ncbi:MAG: protein kinase [Gemmatimonadota bacterium]|nr:protein kinase [Gemmatimonadota bacterium]
MNELSPDRWRQVGTLFSELVVLGPAQQRSRLSDIGDSDPALRSALEALLAADTIAAERLTRFDFGVSEILHRNAPLAGAASSDPLGLAGSTLSHFRVLEYLASGGMGVVYRAQDTRLNRPVALKFPLPRTRMEAAVKERFVREAKAVGALDHVNLCTVYEVGEAEHGLFIAMPLYPGETLKERLSRSGGLSIDDALTIGRQIAVGLAHAHAAGVVHRDLKPGNVMLLPDGTAKILDFGLAKVGDLSQTRSGAALGTISYMAPEQIRGAAVDARADLWSLGVLLYEMLTGVRPFPGEHEVSIAHAILHDDPRPPSAVRTDLPRQVQNLVLSLLQKDAAVRYTSAKEVADDIDAIQRGMVPSFRPRAGTRAAAWMRRRGVYVAFLLAIGLTAAIAVAGPRLSSALNKPTKNDQAYQFYLRGREYEQRGPYAAAESVYHRALALDSGFALARARLAIVYAACRSGGSRDCYRRSIEDLPVYKPERIRTEAQGALRLQPRLADAHLAMGLYWEQREDPARALEEYELARNGLEKTGELHAAIGRAYRAQGRWDDALGELERAVTLDPRDVTSVADLATTYSRLRRYEESVRNWNRYLALEPDAYNGMLIRGNVYLRWHGTIDTLAAILQRLPPEWQRRSVGTRVLVARIRRRPDLALRALDEGPRQSAEAAMSYQSHALSRAQVYADLGDSLRARAYYDTARTMLERGSAGKSDDYRGRLALGLAYAGLGRAQQAKQAADSALTLMPPSRTVPAGTTAMRGAAEIFAQLPEYHTLAIDLLDRLMQMPAGREASVPLLRVDPAWNPIRGDPRFQQILARYSAR